MPRVLDKNGHELTVGAQVRHATDGLVGKVADFDLHRKKVRVTWERQSLIGAIGASMSPLGRPGIQSLGDPPHLTAPDLLLIDFPTERKD
jgi:hypothetical protein